MELDAVIGGISAAVPRDAETRMGEDGLLHCGRCGGAREKVIQIGERVLTVPCICPCMKEQLDREDREQAAKEQVQAVRRYRRMGFPDTDMARHTFAEDDGTAPRMRAAMESYVEHFKEFHGSGQGLYLYGDVGTGKSFWAACIVNALIDRGRPCLMTNFPRLANSVGQTWDKQDYIDNLTRYDLIAIDDLGVERDTDYMNEAVTTIIDSLYRAKVPMVVTSNHAPKVLLGEGEMRKRRVYDRILERCHPVLVDGESRRKQTGRSTYHSMNRMLGLE